MTLDLLDPRGDWRIRFVSSCYGCRAERVRLEVVTRLCSGCFARERDAAARSIARLGADLAADAAMLYEHAERCIHCSRWLDKFNVSRANVRRSCPLRRVPGA